MVTAIAANVSSSTGFFYLTCANPSLNLIASGANTYTWQGPGGTFTGSILAVNQPGTYTLTGATPSVSGIYIVSVVSNTFAPSVNVNPAVQTMSCGSNGATSVSLTTGGNSYYTHVIAQPQPSPLFMTGSQILVTPGSPGTYSVFTTDTLNGCITVSTFTANTANNFPSFNVLSPQNFSLGCAPANMVVLNIVNANTTPPGGAMTFSIQGPPTSTLLPVGPLLQVTTFTVNQPGTWTLTARDNATQCDSKVYVSVISNTLPPVVSLSANPPLTCATLSNVLLASANVNGSFVWTFSGTPGAIFGPSLAVQANMILPTATLANQYTLTVTDNITSCQATQVVPVFQNLFRPNAKIIVGGINMLTCTNPSLMLTNASTSGIPLGTFPNLQPVVGLQWWGPLPQASLGLSTTYVAYTTGTYTLIAQDSNNGCTSMTTMVIGDNKVYPVVNNPDPGPVCLSGLQTPVVPVISGSTPNLTYTWTAPPSASVQGVNSAVLLTDLPGVYTVTVMDPANGCKSVSQMTVQFCSGTGEQTMHTISLFPNPAADVLFIDNTGMANQTAELYNALGQCLLRARLGQGLNQVNVQQLPPGQYTMRLSNAAGQSQYKNVIKN